MKPIIGSLALAALLSVPSLAQAEGTGLYVAPKAGLGWLNGYDMKYVFSNGEDSDKYSVGSDSTYSGAIAVGYDFKRLGVPVRAELEYALFSNAKSKEKKRFDYTYDWAEVNLRPTIGIKTLFANGYYDFHNSSAFTPYVGLGLGLSFVDMKVKGRTEWGEDDTVTDVFTFSFGKKTTTNFAWNLSGGFSYALTDRIGLDLGYRFAWIGKGKTKKGYDYDEYEYCKAKDLHLHQVMLGMRYSF
jgi:opacity protein-like surface antigen